LWKNKRIDIETFDLTMNPIPVHKCINKLCVEINSIAANVVKQQTHRPKVRPQSQNNKFHLASLLAFVRLTIPNIPSTFRNAERHIMPLLSNQGEIELPSRSAQNIEQK
jgi:hypothetical protein